MLRIGFSIGFIAIENHISIAHNYFKPFGVLVVEDWHQS